MQLVHFEAGNGKAMLSSSRVAHAVVELYSYTIASKRLM
jgi:hypothetical protein